MHGDVEKEVLELRRGVFEAVQAGVPHVGEVVGLIIAAMFHPVPTGGRAVLVVGVDVVVAHIESGGVTVNTGYFNNDLKHDCKFNM